MNLLSNREELYGNAHWSRIKQCILCALDPADLSAEVDTIFDDPTNYVLAISPALPAPDNGFGVGFVQTILYQERVAVGESAQPIHGETETNDHATVPHDAGKEGRMTWD